MSGTAPSDLEIRHATTVAVAGRGVMIEGCSGSGKSQLAVRLLGLGARLVADDRTCIRPGTGAVPLWAEAPDGLPPRIEVRGIGLVPARLFGPAPLLAVVKLDAGAEPVRMPQPHHCLCAGCRVRLFYPLRDGDLAAALTLAVPDLSLRGEEMMS